MDIPILEDQSQLVQDIVLVVSIVLSSIAIGYLFKRFILRRISKFTRTTSFTFDDIVAQLIKQINIFLYIALGLLIAMRFVDMNRDLDLLIVAFSAIVIGFYIIFIVDFLLRRSLTAVLRRDDEEDSDIENDKTVIRFISVIAKATLWGILFILVVQNAGYNVSALLGGLGVIGLAVAFSVQNILEDIFSFLSIYFDKPFKVGDFITTENDAGFIRKIGIKSTRVETLEGQELIISNKELTSSRINNYKRMQRRRVQFDFGVEYSTTNDTLKKINNIFQNIFKDLEIADLDRVHFKAFGDYALVFEAVYFVNSPDYNVYMDIQQKVNLEIKRLFEEESIEMAFPSQKVIVVQ